MKNKPEDIKLPKEPNFVKDIDFNAIPYVYIELLLQTSAQLKGLRFQMSHLVSLVNHLVDPKSDFQCEFEKIMKAADDAALEEYQNYLLFFAKMYPKSASKKKI